MNVDKLVNWGHNTLSYLDYEKSKDAKEFDKSTLYEKLGWIYGFRDKLKDWKILVDIVETANNYINFVGLFKNVHKDLEDELSEFTAGMVKIGEKPIEKFHLKNVPGKSAQNIFCFKINKGWAIVMISGMYIIFSHFFEEIIVCLNLKKILNDRHSRALLPNLLNFLKKVEINGKLNIWRLNTKQSFYQIRFIT
jgi:hypothetical protein